MSFIVNADAYDRFMGRYAGPLAARFADFARVTAGRRALDVGCGPGALTGRLVELLGTTQVAAIDPSGPFVAAATERFPGLDVRRGAAESLPYPDDSFDVALAQLVVQFMDDPVLGLREMARVTRPGGVIAACVWDHAGGSGPLSGFWRAAHELDAGAPAESQAAGARDGQLPELCTAAGLRQVETGVLTVEARFATFADWWEPFTLGVGPTGAYVAGLDESRRELLRARCAERLPAPPFGISASAWCVRAQV